LRTLRRFFLVSSPADAVAAVLDVFFAALEPSVVFAGAFEAVPLDAGALPAVEAGLGAIAMDYEGQRVANETVVGRRDNAFGRRHKRPLYIDTRDFVTICLCQQRVTARSGC
jgi:hypothetical protein